MRLGSAFIIAASLLGLTFAEGSTPPECVGNGIPTSHAQSTVIVWQTSYVTQKPNPTTSQPPPRPNTVTVVHTAYTTLNPITMAHPPQRPNTAAEGYQTTLKTTTKPQPSPAPQTPTNQTPVAQFLLWNWKKCSDFAWQQGTQIQLPPTRLGECFPLQRIQEGLTIQYMAPTCTIYMFESPKCDSDPLWVDNTEKEACHMIAGMKAYSVKCDEVM